MQTLRKVSKELEAITFTNVTSDSPLALAIQTAIDLGAKKLYLVGFDGYDVNINQNQFVIAQENQQVIDAAVSIEGVMIKTFTPTKYKNLEIVSLDLMEHSDCLEALNGFASQPEKVIGKAFDSWIDSSRSSPPPTIVRSNLPGEIFSK